MKYFVKKMRGTSMWVVFCPDGAIQFEYSWKDAMTRVSIEIASLSA